MLDECPKCHAKAHPDDVKRFYHFGSIIYPCGSRYSSEDRWFPSSQGMLGYRERQGLTESKQCLRNQIQLLKRLLEIERKQNDVGDE